MQIRDRIKELRRVRAADLRPNPRNWRQHGPAQRDAMCGVLAQVGYADALLAREAEDGALELIDGHLRAETTPDQMVPVLVLDVDREEADLVLATHDPLAAMAAADRDQLKRLLDDVPIENDAVGEMLDDLLGEERTGDIDQGQEEIQLQNDYQVVVECEDERQRREVYDQLVGKGYTCRVLTFEV